MVLLEGCVAGGGFEFQKPTPGQSTLPLLPPVGQHVKLSAAALAARLSASRHDNHGLTLLSCNPAPN